MEKKMKKLLICSCVLLSLQIMIMPAQGMEEDPDPRNIRAYNVENGLNGMGQDLNLEILREAAATKGMKDVQNILGTSKNFQHLKDHKFFKELVLNKDIATTLPKNEEGEFVINLTSCKNGDEILEKLSPYKMSPEVKKIELILGETDRTSIPAIALGHLPFLESIQLNCGNFKNLPEALLPFKNLIKDLKLRSITSDSLSKINAENFPNLQSLDLSGTKVSTLPTSISKLTNLQSLNLSRTNISELSESIGNLTNLQYLGLSGTECNDISKLPPVLRDRHMRGEIRISW